MPKGTVCVVFIPPAHGGWFCCSCSFPGLDLLHSRLRMLLSSGLELCSRGTEVLPPLVLINVISILVSSLQFSLAVDLGVDSVPSSLAKLLKAMLLTSCAGAPGWIPSSKKRSVLTKPQAGVLNVVSQRRSRFLNYWRSG